MKSSICALLLAFVCSVSGERILIFEPFGSKSHKNVFLPIAYGLLDQGHDVTFFTFITDKNFVEKGGREVICEKLDFAKMAKDFPNFFDLRLSGALGKVKQLMSMGGLIDSVAEIVYDDPAIENLMNEKFDLVIHSLAFSDSFLPIVKHWDCPYIYLSPAGMFPGMIKYFGGSEEYASHPGLMTSYPAKMSFLQRVGNVIGGEFGAVAFGSSAVASGLKHAKRKGISHPPYDEMRKNASLALLNTHFSINNLRSLPPTVIEVGGMHCRPAAPLPSDLEEFVSGAGDDGFIVFGLGSAIQVSDMPMEFQKMFLNAFARLKQRVIWKWEKSGFDSIPDNVKLVKWLPQQDLLGHPSIKAFLSHGGLLSIQEAVYHGVPLIGLPLGSDQDLNVAKAVRDGYALPLDWNNLSEEIIYNTIQEIVSKDGFKERARHHSELMRDQKETPLERAIFWIEYVIRHRGAPHLQSPAKDLSRLQRNLADVIAFLGSIAILSLVVTLYVTKMIISCLIARFTGDKKRATFKSKKTN